MNNEHCFVPGIILVSAGDLGDMMNISVRHIRRMDAAGKLPKPVRLGHCVRWRADEIQAWLSAGAPKRDVWRTMQEQRK